jgi:hypothetical protein
MGRDISLILASADSLANIVKAGQGLEKETNLLEAIDNEIKEDEGFKEYLQEVSEKLDFSDTKDFNLTAGYYATWILTAYSPAWYLRNCSVSLFLEDTNADERTWSRYTSDWPTDLLSNTTILNHFAAANYSLGCLISPENARNFVHDYKEDLVFKQSVDSHFGVFVWGLFDALDAAASSDISLIESMDIFGLTLPDTNNGTIKTVDQSCYSIDTYDLTNLAIQSFSILIQTDGGYIHKYTQEGNEEKVRNYQQDRQNTVDMLVRNATRYADSVAEKTGLELPKPATNMWL